MIKEEIVTLCVVQTSSTEPHPHSSNMTGVFQRDT